MLILPWFWGWGWVVLLCLKTQSRAPPMLLQPVPRLLPWTPGVGQNCTLMGEMVALGIPLSSSTLPFSVRLGTWGPSDYTAMERDVPCRARACEARSGHVAPGHLQVPNRTYDLPGICLPSGKAYHLFYCFKGCFHWLTILNSSTCSP